MSDEYQILIPPSFEAVHADARGRLRVPIQTLRERYELCEDLAQQLTEHARGLLFQLGVAESDVLERLYAGLVAEGGPVPPDEGAWVTRRLAELLDWPWPEYLGHNEA